MKQICKLLLILYLTNLTLLYVPNAIFPGAELIEGVMGMTTKPLYGHGYFFLLLLSVFQVAIIGVIRRYPREKHWYVVPLYVSGAYVLFILFSTIFIEFHIVERNAWPEVDELIKRFADVLIGALVFGIPIIVFSPITYLIMLNYFLIYRFTGSDLTASYLPQSKQNRRFSILKVLFSNLCSRRNR